MRLFCEPTVLIDGVDKEGCMSPSEYFTFSSFFFLHLSVSFAKSVFKHPVLFSGPHNPINSVNIPRENNKENPMVQNINTPNCMKNCNTAKNINADAPRVVHAPENTEVPISFNMSRVLFNLSLCSDK